MIQKRTKEMDTKEKKELYTIFYKNNEDLRLQFAMYYDPSGGGKIILKNQKGFYWTRRKAL